MKKYCKALKKYVFDSDYRFFINVNYGFYTSMTDEEFLKKKYECVFHRALDLNAPQTYNEKLQWLKLYDRKPIYTTMVDKYLVKDYVAKIIGKEHIIPTIGVWDSAEDIDFDSLPNRFVLKCNHNSGTGMYICKDKSALTPADLRAIRRGLEKGLAENFYLHNREWPYKNVQRRILAEEYMEDETCGELRDYKFFTFNGKVKALFVASDRQDPNEETKFDFFDLDYNHLPFTNGHPNAKSIPEKPQNFERMKKLAEILAKDIPHVRVDFYECNGKVYFGEMTFFHWSGMMPFDPPEWDETFGSYLTLPDKSI